MMDLVSRRWLDKTARASPMLAAIVITAIPCAAQERRPDGELDDCAPITRKSYAIAAGAQLGLLLPVGLGAMLSLPREGKLQWEVDVVWEPSNYLQSYSVGGAYHPWGKLFFVGARLRFMQLHAPWSRGFRARTDNQLAMGPELGIRFPVGTRPRFLPFASLGAIFFPSETLSLPPMYSLNVGAAVDLVSR